MELATGLGLGLDSSGLIERQRLRVRVWGWILGRCEGGKTMGKRARL